ncbi:putative phosphoenolpyruvate carboxylase [Helianthus anomalus]
MKKGGRNLEKMGSIDAQLRLLAPAKVSDDDKLVEYDALLLDRFLDILHDLHGEDIRQTVLDIRTLVTDLVVRVGLAPFS